MNNYKHTKTVLDTIKIKGLVSDDGSEIIYEKDKEEYSADIADIMKRYAGEIVAFSIGIKNETELEDE